MEPQILQICNIFLMFKTQRHDEVMKIGSVILMCHKNLAVWSYNLITLVNSFIPLMDNQIQFYIIVICVSKFQY